MNAQNCSQCGEVLAEEDLKYDTDTVRCGWCGYVENRRKITKPRPLRERWIAAITPGHASQPFDVRLTVTRPPGTPYPYLYVFLFTLAIFLPVDVLLLKTLWLRVLVLLSMVFIADRWAKASLNYRDHCTRQTFQKLDELLISVFLNMAFFLPLVLYLIILFPFSGFQTIWPLSFGLFGYLIMSVKAVLQNAHPYAAVPNDGEMNGHNGSQCDESLPTEDRNGQAKDVRCGWCGYMEPGNADKKPGSGNGKGNLFQSWRSASRDGYVYCFMLVIFLPVVYQDEALGFKELFWLGLSILLAVVWVNFTLVYRDHCATQPHKSFRLFLTAVFTNPVFWAPFAGFLALAYFRFGHIPSESFFIGLFCFTTMNLYAIVWHKHLVPDAFRA